MSLPIAILAGGLATRLYPVAEKTPKSLLEVAGRPFAVHQLELLRRNGLNRVVFCLGYLGSMVENALGDGGRFKMKLSYVYDGPVLLGTGGAIRKALPSLGDAFFVLYGDSYLACDYAAVEQAFRDSGMMALMTVFRNENRWDQSNVLFREGRILAYDKRNPNREMHHIDYGLEVMKAEAFNGYSAETPLDLAEIFRDLHSRDQLAGFEVKSRFYEIGSPEGLEETRRYLSEKRSPEE